MSRRRNYMRRMQVDKKGQDKQDGRKKGEDRWRGRKIAELEL
jgi:hypothetical protein